MSKTKQLLVVDPPELRFRGPFTDVVTASIKLFSTKNSRIGFKVKTNAPKYYCVRPSKGIIEPKSFTSVKVLLQPNEYDPVRNRKHKFLVQAVVVPKGKIDQDALWDKALPKDIASTKLECVFGDAASRGRTERKLDDVRQTEDSIRPETSRDFSSSAKSRVTDAAKVAAEPSDEQVVVQQLVSVESLEKSVDEIAAPPATDSSYLGNIVFGSFQSLTIDIGQTDSMPATSSVESVTFTQEKPNSLDPPSAVPSMPSSVDISLNGSDEQIELQIHSWSSFHSISSTDASKVALTLSKEEDLEQQIIPSEATKEAAEPPISEPLQPEPTKSTNASKVAMKPIPEEDVEQEILPSKAPEKMELFSAHRNQAVRPTALLTENMPHSMIIIPKTEVYAFYPLMNPDDDMPSSSNSEEELRSNAAVRGSSPDLQGLESGTSPTKPQVKKTTQMSKPAPRNESVTYMPPNQAASELRRLAGRIKQLESECEDFHRHYDQENRRNIPARKPDLPTEPVISSAKNANLQAEPAVSSTRKPDLLAVPADGSAKKAGPKRKIGQETVPSEVAAKKPGPKGKSSHEAVPSSQVEDPLVIFTFVIILIMLGMLFGNIFRK